jgi:hypothetical protein
MLSPLINTVSTREKRNELPKSTRPGRPFGDIA